MQSSHRWRLPLWAGVVVGIGFAAALSWLLHEGSKQFAVGFDLLQRPEAITGVLLLFGAGALLGGLVAAPRLHPLVSGVPAAWFIIAYGPSLFRWVPPEWYPQWIDAFFIPTRGPAVWIILGLLVVVTAVSLTVGWRGVHDADRYYSRMDSSRTEQVG